MALKRLERQTIEEKYMAIYIQIEKIGINLTKALEFLLKENHIPFLSINFRIETIDSLIGKIERKDYTNPIELIEGICGLRIVCYYQSDFTKIESLISEELFVLGINDKGDNHEFEKFGNISQHFIIKIQNNRELSHIYEGYNNLKGELKVKTELLHSRAEVEQKLGYKTKSKIQKEFRSKLSGISTILEKVDDQFEDIERQLKDKNEQDISIANQTKLFYELLEFNLCNLQEFLDFAFADRKKSIEYTEDLFYEMLKYNLSLKELAEGYEKTRSFLRKLEQEVAVELSKLEEEEVEEDIRHFRRTKTRINERGIGNITTRI